VESGGQADHDEAEGTREVLRRLTVPPSRIPVGNADAEIGKIICDNTGAGQGWLSQARFAVFPMSSSVRGGYCRRATSVQWSGPGSNRRPPGCKPGALPAELPPRGCAKVNGSPTTYQADLPRKKPEPRVLPGAPYSASPVGRIRYGANTASTPRTTSVKSGSPAPAGWSPSSKLIVQFGKVPVRCPAGAPTGGSFEPGVP
jgi:hypothetical protein